MSYRDDLDAAQARNQALESRLDDANRRIQELEDAHERDAIASKPKKPKNSGPRPHSPRGKVFHVRPRSYVPVLRLLLAAMRTRLAGPSAPSSDSLWAWLAYRAIARPLYYLLLMPLLWTVVYTYFFLFGVLTAPLVASVLYLGGFRLASKKRGSARVGSSFLNSTGSEAVTMVLIISASTAPAIVPFALLALVYSLG